MYASKELYHYMCFDGSVSTLLKSFESIFKSFRGFLYIIWFPFPNLESEIPAQLLHFG